MFSDDEKQKTTSRGSTIYEGSYNEDVLIMTLAETMMIKNYKKHMMYAKHENAYQEDELPMTFEKNVVIENHKEDTKRLAMNAVTSEEGERRA